MSRPMQNAALPSMILALSLLLAGCGQSKQAASIHAQHQGNGTTKASSGGIDPDMVGAVNLAGTSASLVSMKFKLASRPVVTMPVQLTVLVIPAPDTSINHIHVSFVPGDGLQLQSEHALDVIAPRPGAPIQQELTLVPQQNGVLSLSATVLVDTDSESISRTYSIPLIATDTHS